MCIVTAVIEGNQDLVWLLEAHVIVGEAAAESVRESSEFNHCQTIFKLKEEHFVVEFVLKEAEDFG